MVARTQQVLFVTLFADWGIVACAFLSSCSLYFGAKVLCVSPWLKFLMCHMTLAARYLYGGLLSAMEWKDYACTLRILLASEAQQLVGECTAACAVCCGDAGAVDLCDHHPIAPPLNSSKPTDSSQSPSSMIAVDESVDLGLADGWCAAAPLIALQYIYFRPQ
jgi:hypothetical protein